MATNNGNAGASACTQNGDAVFIHVLRLAKNIEESMSFFRIFICCGLILTVSACSSRKSDRTEKAGSSKSEVEINLKVEKIQLDNGLTVLVVENSKLPIYSIYTFYKVGSKFETPGITGASHYLEHMMFKGAKKFKEGEFDHYIEQNGGNTNAYTTQDQTVYYENLPSHTLPKIIEMEADRIQNLALNPDAFEKERKVILEERKYRYENSPRGQLYQAMFKEVFRGTPYESSVIGSIPDLEKVSREQIQTYFKTFYAPNNAVMVIVGDVTKSQVSKLINEHFKVIPASGKLAESKKLTKTYDLQLPIEKRIKLKGNAPEPMFSLAFAGDKVGVRRAFALDLLASILSDGNSSYLNQRFVSGKNQILSQVSVANYNLEEAGIFYISGSVINGSKFDSFDKDLRIALKASCQTAVTEKNIQKAKNQFLIRVYSELEDNDGVASFLGIRESLMGDYAFYQKEFPLYDSITKDELIKTCQDIFSSTNNIMISLWNKN